MSNLGLLADLDVGSILSHADELIRDSVYVGSHIDYLHPDGSKNVHYFVANAIADNSNNVVVFAVHDPIESNAGYKEKAYIIEMVTIQENKEGASGDHGEGEPSNMDLTHQTPSTVTIGDLIRNVNTDRF